MRVVRTVPLWLAIVLVLASVATTAIALNIWTLQVKRIDIWTGQVQPTDFTVEGFNTKIKGLNKIEITVTLKNTDSTAHSANVTVQLLDANGNIILEQTQNTGSVVGGSTWTGTFTFQQNDLVSTYDRHFLIVEQTA